MIVDVGWAATDVDFDAGTVVVVMTWLAGHATRKSAKCCH